MHDELVKGLRNNADHYMTVDGEAGLVHLLTDAADAIEKLSVVVRVQKAALDTLDREINNKPRWIPVTERLPDAEPGDVSERVFVTDGENVAIVEWFNFEECGPFWGYTGFGKDVTHWMQLPTPPKEETA